MRLFVALTAGALILTPGWIGAQVVSTDNQGKLEALVSQRDFDRIAVEATRMIGRAGPQLVLAYMLQRLEPVRKRKAITDDQLNDFARRLVQTRITPDLGDLRSGMIQKYASLTSREVDEMIAFYTSPTGRKVVQIEVAIGGQIEKMVGQALEKSFSAVTPELDRLIDEFAASLPALK